MKRTIYRLVVDIWRLACKYQFRRLSGSEWQAFVSDGERLLEKYRECGHSVEILYRELFQAVLHFYEQMD